MKEKLAFDWLRCRYVMMAILNCVLIYGGTRARGRASVERILIDESGIHNAEVKVT